MTAKTIGDKTRKPKQTVKQRDKLRSLAAKAAPHPPAPATVARLPVVSDLEKIDDLREALRVLHDDCAEYQAINHLGGYSNHVMLQARRALSKAGLVLSSANPYAWQTKLSPPVAMGAEPKASEPKSFLSRMWKWVRG